MGMRPCHLLLLALLQLGAGEQPGPSVVAETALGRLEGERVVLVEGGWEWKVFRGIPYALPPLRELRFRVLWKWHSERVEDEVSGAAEAGGSGSVDGASAGP